MYADVNDRRPNTLGETAVCSVRHVMPPTADIRSIIRPFIDSPWPSSVRELGELHS